MAGKLTKTHHKTEEKIKKQQVIAHSLCLGYSQKEIAKRTHVPESTIRSWFVSDPEFQTVVLEAAKKAGRKLLPKAMSVVKEMLESGHRPSQKWAVEKIFDLNKLTGKESVAEIHAQDSAVQVNIGLDGSSNVEVTDEDIGRADRILADEWDKFEKQADPT